MSWGDRKYPWALPQLPETDELMRPVTRRPPGDYSTPEAMTMGRAELAKRKNSFFEDAFTLHVGGGSPRRERLLGDFMVVAELKTNVIIGDEFVFITELSAKLAERFQRPLSSVAVHPVTNRRNAYLLSEHLEEALGVSSTRGLIRFTGLAEEDVALDGRTLAQSLEEDVDASGAMAVIDEEKPASSARRNRLSVKSFSNFKTSNLAGDITPPTSAEDGPPTAAEKPQNATKVISRRKSFVAGLFGKSDFRKENKKQVAESS
ncbi:hypothetical protein SLS53_009517 [Cytospora paraplurivora]|uniref:Uncharacterized protein n=1 Tax=Cytospora paraplurivora TaxID=2898453 RepID=A0AAN9TWE1_9PEZI